MANPVFITISCGKTFWIHGGTTKTDNETGLIHFSEAEIWEASCNVTADSVLEEGKISTSKASGYVSMYEPIARVHNTTTNLVGRRVGVELALKLARQQTFPIK